MATDLQDQFEELLNSFQTAMLVTQTGTGAMRSRPMALAHRAENGDLFFATKADAGKVNEILKHPGVNVAMQKSDAYLSISGKAQIINDQSAIDKLWKPSWKLWFEGGKTDPSIVLIKVHATRGEYWNFDTADKLQFAFEAGKAILSGESIDAEAAGDHAKVSLA